VGVPPSFGSVTGPGILSKRRPSKGRGLRLTAENARKVEARGIAPCPAAPAGPAPKIQLDDPAGKRSGAPKAPVALRGILGNHFFATGFLVDSRALSSSAIRPVTGVSAVAPGISISYSPYSAACSPRVVKPYFVRN
jgi:hypothetical protein